MTRLLSLLVLLCSLALVLAACGESVDSEAPSQLDGRSVRGVPDSASFPTILSSAPGYCPSSGGSTEYEFIQDVSFTQNANATLTILVDVYITNPGGCTAGNPCPEYDNSPEYVNLWIDWNDDGTWSATEKVVDVALTGYTSINYAGVMSASATIPIPADTATPVPWARANLGWEYDPDDACATSWTWGNVVDELVFIDLPYIETITVTPDPNPETTKDVTLTATVHEVDGFTIQNIHWDDEVDPAGDGYPAYTYRPIAGSHGGDKWIEATMTFVQDDTGTSGQDVNYEQFDLFFDKDGDEDGDGTDNWYEHWSQTADQATSIDDGRNGGTYAYIGGGYNQSLYGNYNSNTAAPLISISNRTSMACAYNFQLSLLGFPIYDFNNNGQGVDCIEVTLDHEWQHYDTDVANMAGGAWHGQADSDGDELPDTLENNMLLAGFGFDENNANSFPAPDFPFGDDEEVWCEIQGYMETGTSSKDWANPGKQSDPAYRMATTGSFNVATFTMNATDYGIDDDGDTLFDWLVVDVELDVLDAGDYYLYGAAWDADGNLVWDDADLTLTPGLQDVSLLFDGPSLRNYGASGPMELFFIQIEGGSVSDIWPISYVTDAYDWSEFDTTLAYFTDNYSDAGVDTDADGTFDELLVTVEVNNDDIAADFELVAWLTNSSGDSLGSSAVTQTLDPGLNTVTMTFFADPIRFGGEAGPFTLTGLDLTLDGDRIDFRPDAYDTAAYALSDFDGGLASLPATWTEGGLDLSGNGQYDQLVFEIDVDTTLDGTHYLWATVVDSAGAEIARLNGQADLTVGVGSIPLVLQGADIIDHGVDGSWTLEDIDLYDPLGFLSETAGGWTTYPWLVSQFGLLITIDGVVGEAAPDADSDGLLDSLDIEVQVTPEGSGLVFALGRLLAPDGSEIGWADASAGHPRRGPEPDALVRRPGDRRSGAGRPLRAGDPAGLALPEPGADRHRVRLLLHVGLVRR